MVRLQVWLLYTQGVKGLGMGFSTGWESVDKHYKVSKGWGQHVLDCVPQWCSANVDVTGPACIFIAAIGSSRRRHRSHT